MKKKAFIVVGVLVALGIIGYIIKGGCEGPIDDVVIGEDTCIEIEPAKPLNLSIYLDLSDRITRESQVERDAAITAYLAKKFKDGAVRKKILPCNDRIKVFFYPSPKSPKVALLSDSLELDLSKTDLPKKRVRLNEFEGEFKKSLEQIYQSTLNTKDWVGSDIWGFFNKPIDTYCIKKGCRNVLVILTDGYIFHANNKLKQGDAYSYILPQTLKVPNSSLIVGRKGLENLEVLMLELNPYDIKDGPKMEKILMTWLQDMGVKKCYVAETDVPGNTRLIIDKFLDD